MTEVEAGAESVGALSGLRVIDLSMYLPGPYATLMLADLGADVVQVEPPTGDMARAVQPRVGDDSALHHWVGRNKRSLVLDLKSADGREAFHRLVKDADVVLEGFTPGVATRLGVDYDACRRTNAEIVYCSISGAGQDDGPRARPGHDINYLARAGFLDQVSGADGTPVPVGPPVADIAAGLHAAVGILAALRYRDAGGGGQYVDVSLLGAALALTAPQIVKALAPVPLAAGSDHNRGADPAYRVYRTKDARHVAIGAFEHKFWQRLCLVLDRPDLIDRRLTEPAAVADELVGVFARKDLAHWDRLLTPADVCYSPVNRLEEVVGDPVVSLRGDFAATNGGLHSRVQLTNPIGMSSTPPTMRTDAPPLGIGIVDVGWARCSGDPE